MKRILIVIANFLFIFGILHAVQIEHSNFNFLMEFEKRGIPEVMFENAAGNQIKDLSFKIPSSPTEPVIAECYIAYHLFSGYGVDLIFIPGNATAADYEQIGTMLSRREGGLGLNFDVSIAGTAEFTFTGSDRQKELSYEDRTLSIVDVANEEMIADGETRKKLTLTMNPPEKGYVEGVYTGYVVMRLNSYQ